MGLSTLYCFKLIKLHETLKDIKFTPLFSTSETISFQSRFSITCAAQTSTYSKFIYTPLDYATPLRIFHHCTLPPVNTTPLFSLLDPNPFVDKNCAFYHCIFKA